jgi:DNA-binding NtrC family response regulator
MQHLLVVEADPTLRDLLRQHLEAVGYRVAPLDSLAEARASLAQADALLLGQELPDGSGIAFLAELHQRQPRLPVIMLAGSSATTLAISATKAGAYDVIRRPVDTTELEAVLRAALHRHSLTRKIVAGDPCHGPATVQGLVGVSQAILDICKTIGRVAASHACVLISGESGAGKEVVARAIHRHSDRKGLFLPVNCSAIVETLLENELFGHEKGSYTGAVDSQPGRFELARDGTLFLDEIGDLSLALQAKLLRVLQDGDFERVGGRQTLRSNARIIAATHRELNAMVAQGAFREDLYYRLNVVSLHLPPLRARPEDLPALVEHLLGRITRQLNKPIAGISEAAWRGLSTYPWPGNVRELENVLTRAVVLARGDTLTPELLVLAPASPASRPPTPASEPLLSLAQLEARHVARVLDETRWNKGRACAILGISRPALERKLRKYALR